MFWSGIADEAGRPVPTQIKAHQALGWTHIELRKVNDTELTFADDDEFERVHAQVREAGLQVSCFASRTAKRPLSASVNEDMTELRTAIPRMHAMGTPFIRVMSWINDTNASEADWRREAIDRMKVLARMAEDGGVTLVHENCAGWAGEGPEQTLDMLAEVHSPALKLVFDTGNPVQHGQDAWDFYSKVKEHIVYVHIKDATRDGEQTTWSWCGEGDGSVRRILKDLLVSGYDGGFSIEPHIASVAAQGGEVTAQVLLDSYLKYDRMAMALVE